MRFLHPLAALSLSSSGVKAGGLLFVLAIALWLFLSVAQAQPIPTGATPDTHFAVDCDGNAEGLRHDDYEATNPGNWKQGLIAAYHAQCDRAPKRRIGDRNAPGDTFAFIARNHVDEQVDKGMALAGKSGKEAIEKFLTTLEYASVRNWSVWLSDKYGQSYRAMPGSQAVVTRIVELQFKQDQKHFCVDGVDMNRDGIASPTNASTSTTDWIKRVREADMYKCSWFNRKVADNLRTEQCKTLAQRANKMIVNREGSGLHEVEGMAQLACPGTTDMRQKARAAGLRGTYGDDIRHVYLEMLRIRSSGPWWADAPSP